MTDITHRLSVYLHPTEHGAELHFGCCCGKFVRVCPQGVVSDIILQEALSEHLQKCENDEPHTPRHDHVSVAAALGELTPVLRGAVTHVGNQEMYRWRLSWLTSAPQLVVSVEPLAGEGAQQFVWDLTAGEVQ